MKMAEAPGAAWPWGPGALGSGEGSAWMLGELRAPAVQTEHPESTQAYLPSSQMMLF